VARLKPLEMLKMKFIQIAVKRGNADSKMGSKVLGFHLGQHFPQKAFHRTLFAISP
jgi:hypothetical protein